MNLRAKLTAVAAGGAAVLALTSPINADDAGAGVLAKLGAATAAQTSFVVSTDVGSLNLGVTIVDVGTKHPKIHLAVTGGAVQLEEYVIDRVVYLQINGGAWQKSLLTEAQFQAQVNQILLARQNTDATLEPDSTDGGVTYGMIRLAMPTPPSMRSLSASLPATLIGHCAYDKTSFLIHSCAYDTIPYTAHYDRYSDPSNVVELPPAATNATTLQLPPGVFGPQSPAPAPVPAPTASAPAQ